MHPFAVPGEIVTCERGHYICQVAEPLVADTVMMPSAFREWRKEDEHKMYDPVRPCSQCGASFVRNGPRGGFQLHVSDEWRP